MQTPHRGINSAACRDSASTRRRAGRAPARQAAASSRRRSRSRMAERAAALVYSMVRAAGSSPRRYARADPEARVEARPALGGRGPAVAAGSARRHGRDLRANGGRQARTRTSSSMVAARLQGGRVPPSTASSIHEVGATQRSRRRDHQLRVGGAPYRPTGTRGVDAALSQRTPGVPKTRRVHPPSIMLVREKPIVTRGALDSPRRSPLPAPGRVRTAVRYAHKRARRRECAALDPRDRAASASTNAPTPTISLPRSARAEVVDATTDMAARRRRQIQRSVLAEGTRMRICRLVDPGHASAKARTGPRSAPPPPSSPPQPTDTRLRKKGTESAHGRTYPVERIISLRGERMRTWTRCLLSDSSAAVLVSSSLPWSRVHNAPTRRTPPFLDFSVIGWCHLPSVG